MKLLIAAILFFASGIATAAMSVQEILVECSKGNDHPRVSACVALRAKNSSVELGRIESEVRAAISELPKEQLNLKAIRSSFETSSRIFKNYRLAFCQAQAEFAVVSMYSAEIGLACEVELNLKRIDELKAGLLWLR